MDLKIDLKKDLEKHFVQTQLSKDNLNTIFLPIFTRFIIINFILLLKVYLQIRVASANDIDKLDNIVKHFLTEQKVKKIYNVNAVIEFINNDKIKDLSSLLKDKLQSDIDKLGDNKFNLIDIVGKDIILFFTYEGNVNENISKLYTILYFLLDYKAHITLEEFKTKIDIYIKSLNEKPTSNKKYEFINECLNTYTESLNILLKNESLGTLEKCNIHYVEFNDINTLNDKTHQLLSIFIFLPNSEEEIETLIISKHFFIIKDIVNHFLYELKLKTQQIIKYSSIILHSYCSYKFKQDFFITNPKQNMNTIFIKYQQTPQPEIPELGNTIEILSDFEVLNKEENITSKLSYGDAIFLTTLITDKINFTELYKTIQTLIGKCKFSNMGIYNGTILFNVKHFKLDWFYLISKYIKTQQQTINTAGGFIKNINKNINKNIKMKTNTKVIKIKNLRKKSNKFKKKSKKNLQQI